MNTDYFQGGFWMEYKVLSNGVKMPQLGYGVYQVTKEECECGCHYGKASIEHEMNEVEHCILKRMFNSVKRFSDQK